MSPWQMLCQICIYHCQLKKKKKKNIYQTNISRKSPVSKLLRNVIRKENMWRLNHRSNRSKNFAKVTEEHLCWILFINNVAGWRPANLLKKRLQHNCFPVNFATFLRTPILQNTSGRLLLKSCWYSINIYFYLCVFWK